MSLKSVAVASAFLSFTAPAAKAQDVSAMYDEMLAQQQAVISAMEEKYKSSMMAYFEAHPELVTGNPRLMAAYGAQVCGPHLTPAQFSYKWEMTGGCTADGVVLDKNIPTDVAAMQLEAWREFTRRRDEKEWGRRASQTIGER